MTRFPLVRNHIGGNFVSARSGERFTSLDQQDGQVRPGAAQCQRDQPAGKAAPGTREIVFLRCHCRSRFSGLLAMRNA